MPSLIIPAHNEAAVLARTLDRVLEDLAPGEVEVIVVCNGCTDASVSIAASYVPLVQVLDLSEASKVAALNAGDAAAETFPRVYLDADIELSSESLRLILTELDRPGALAAEPVPNLDTTRSSPLVRAWYRVWQGLYGGAPGTIGSGVCGMSSAGRARFGQFPSITADDAFVRAHFGSQDLVYVPGASSRVIAPRTVRDLIRIKTRSRLGTMELQREFPDLTQARPTNGRKSRLPLRLWPVFPWYAGLTLFVRLRARHQAARGQTVWERDDSSRLNE